MRKKSRSRKGRPQALKRGYNLKRHSGTSKLAPFPFVYSAEFFRGR